MSYGQYILKMHKNKKESNAFSFSYRILSGCVSDPHTILAREYLAKKNKRLLLMGEELFKEFSKMNISIPQTQGFSKKELEVQKQLELQLYILVELIKGSNFLMSCCAAFFDKKLNPMKRLTELYPLEDIIMAFNIVTGSPCPTAALFKLVLDKEELERASYLTKKLATKNKGKRIITTEFYILLENFVKDIGDLKQEINIQFFIEKDISAEEYLQHFLDQE